MRGSRTTTGAFGQSWMKPSDEGRALHRLQLAMLEVLSEASGPEQAIETLPSAARNASVRRMGRLVRAPRGRGRDAPRPSMGRACVVFFHRAAHEGGRAARASGRFRGRRDAGPRARPGAGTHPRRRQRALRHRRPHLAGLYPVPLPMSPATSRSGPSSHRSRRDDAARGRSGRGLLGAGRLRALHPLRARPPPLLRRATLVDPERRWPLASL